MAIVVPPSKSNVPTIRGRFKSWEWGNRRMNTSSCVPSAHCAITIAEVLLILKEVDFQ
jgi:hypothetical protein